MPVFAWKQIIHVLYGLAVSLCLAMAVIMPVVLIWHNTVLLALPFFLCFLYLLHKAILSSIRITTCKQE